MKRNGISYSTGFMGDDKLRVWNHLDDGTVENMMVASKEDGFLSLCEQIADEMLIPSPSAIMMINNNARHGNV